MSRENLKVVGLPLEKQYIYSKAVDILTIVHKRNLLRNIHDLGLRLESPCHYQMHLRVNGNKTDFENSLKDTASVISDLVY